MSSLTEISELSAKIQYTGTLRRLIVAKLSLESEKLEIVTWNHFEENVRILFAIPPEKSIVVTYKDAEDDLVQVDSNGELREVIEDFRDGKITSLKFDLEVTEQENEFVVIPSAPASDFDTLSQDGDIIPILDSSLLAPESSLITPESAPTEKHIEELKAFNSEEPPIASEELQSESDIFQNMPIVVGNEVVSNFSSKEKSTDNTNNDLINVEKIEIQNSDENDDILSLVEEIGLRDPVNSEEYKSEISNDKGKQREIIVEQVESTSLNDNLPEMIPQYSSDSKEKTLIFDNSENSILAPELPERPSDFEAFVEEVQPLVNQLLTKIESRPEYIP
ncbi:hypothetical protein HK096_011489, partial [Nowakowskiella sp. JEL0078]